MAASADVVRIKSFGYPELSVWNPCGLIEGTDGLLYGASAHGGTVGFGSLFRINKDGGDLVVLHDFQSTNDGSWLTSRLLEATNGTLYGTTSQGGIANAGTIFRINKDGTEYEILHHFQTDTNGGYPQAALIQGQDGFLYGTTRFPGTVFRIGPDGNNYDVILRFAEVRPVVYPDVALLQTENGSLYGAAGRFLQFETTSVVFKVNPDGSGYQQLYEFDPAKNAGTGPSELVEGDDGRLYGTAGRGGNKGAGTIFSLNIDGTDFRVLHQFAGGGDGEGPSGRLIKGTNGLFYGITARGGSARKGTLFVFNPLRNSHKVLRSLGSLRNSGAYPAELVLDSQAPAWYGVTGAGGSADDGVLFRFTLEGARYEKLVDFKNHGGDGSQPDTQLAQGPDGMLYGTTTFGGAPGFGTIFRLNTNGSSYQILWEFQGGRKSGNPVSVVVDPTNGALSGTTGEFSVGLLPNGTVFRLNTNGSYMPLHRFSGNDGSRPNALLQGSDGFLYGTTQYGGFGQAGVIFKLRNNGSKFQVLRLFSGRPDDGGYRPPR